MTFIKMAIKIAKTVPYIMPLLLLDATMSSHSFPFPFEQKEEQQAYTDQYTGPLPPLLHSLSEQESCKKLDLMFLIDATGSMDTEIALVESKAEIITQTISKQGLDVRMAVALVQDAPGAYGYETDQPYALLSDFSHDPMQTSAALQSIKIGSGGDHPEAYSYALRMASNEAWREDAKRLLLLFADSIARDEQELEESVRTANFRFYSIVSSYSYYWERHSLGAYQMEASTDLIPVILTAVQKECSKKSDLSERLWQIERTLVKRFI